MTSIELIKLFNKCKKEGKPVDFNGETLEDYEQIFETCRIVRETALKSLRENKYDNDLLEGQYKALSNLVHSNMVLKEQFNYLMTSLEQIKLYNEKLKKEKQ